MKKFIALVFIGMILAAIVAFCAGNYQLAFGIGFVGIGLALGIGNYYQFETRDFLHREYDHKRYIERFKSR